MKYGKVGRVKVHFKNCGFQLLCVSSLPPYGYDKIYTVLKITYLFFKYSFLTTAWEFFGGIGNGINLARLPI